MPLARIFTHHPERTTSLQEELRQQGYQVEVRGPDQIHLAPADLEIEFEICDRADVLDRAASLADGLKADVAVAPGVLQPIAQRADGPLPAEAPAQKPLEVVPVDAAFTGRDPEREFEAAFASIPETTSPEQGPAMIENPAVEYAPLPPVQFAEDPAPMRPGPVVFPVHESAAYEEAAHEEASRPAALEGTARLADPVPYLAQLKPFSTPSAHTQTQTEESGPLAGETWHESQEATASGPAASAMPGIGSSAANIFSTALAGAKSMSASTAESFRGWLQEYRKRAQVRSAEARAARVARMLDLEQRKAEAQQRAAELEAAREAAAARLVELVREREPGLPEKNLPEKSLQEKSFSEGRRREESWSMDREAPASKPLPRRTPVESLRHASIAGLSAKPRRPLSPQLRAVLTGAAAISVVFVIGIVLGELYPRAPIAKPVDHAANGVTMQTGTPQSGAQQAGGVTMQTGAPQSGAQAGGVTLQAGVPAQAPRPQPSASAAQSPAQEKPSPRVSQARRIAQQQGEDTVGEDVVVRHFKQPVPTAKPKQSGQQAGLKHFSDLDN
jgi:hypothetical protein